MTVSFDRAVVGAAARHLHEPPTMAIALSDAPLAAAQLAEHISSVSLRAAPNSQVERRVERGTRSGGQEEGRAWDLGSGRIWRRARIARRLLWGAARAPRNVAEHGDHRVDGVELEAAEVELVPVRRGALGRGGLAHAHAHGGHVRRGGEVAAGDGREVDAAGDDLLDAHAHARGGGAHLYRTRCNRLRGAPCAECTGTRTPGVTLVLTASEGSAP